MLTLWITVGAAAGAHIRFFLSNAPFGILIANLIGAFLIGFLSGRFSREVQIGVSCGFLGSLTTFSAFSLESTEQLFAGEYLFLGLNVAAHVIGSIGMTSLGLYCRGLAPELIQS